MATWSRLNRVQKSCQGLRPSTLLMSSGDASTSASVVGPDEVTWLILQPSPGGRAEV